MAEAQARISSQEFVEWQAYARLDPFGSERGDVQAAVVAQTVANANRGPKTPAYKLEDFVLKFDQPDALSPEDLRAKVKAIHAMFGGSKT